MLLCIGPKNEVSRFNRNWDMDNCLENNLNDVIMTSSPIRILWNLYTNRPRVYLSDIPNLILIKHKRAEIQGREVNRELWRKKLELRHCDLDLWPKVTKFNRVRATNGSNHLAKTASKLVHPFGWNFVHKNFWTDTHTLTDTQTNCSENITPPRFRGGVKKQTIGT